MQRVSEEADMDLKRENRRNVKIYQIELKKAISDAKARLHSPAEFKDEEHFRTIAEFWRQTNC